MQYTKKNKHTYAMNEIDVVFYFSDFGGRWVLYSFFTEFNSYVQHKSLDRS